MASDAPAQGDVAEGLTGAPQDEQMAGPDRGDQAGEAPPPAAPPPPAEPPNPLADKITELTVIVEEQPDDFASWAALLALVDRLDDPARLREAYESFLERHPLAFGYWQRYADAERRHGGQAAAAAVYERGVAATPTSGELWLAYVQALAAGDVPTEQVRSVLRRALDAAGQHYHSGRLWEHALALESSSGSPASVASVYSGALLAPLRDLERMHAGLLAHAASRTAHELLEPEAAARLRATLQQQQQQRQQQQAADRQAVQAAADEAEGLEEAEAEARGGAGADANAGASPPEGEGDSAMPDAAAEPLAAAPTDAAAGEPPPGAPPDGAAKAGSEDAGPGPGAGPSAPEAEGGGGGGGGGDDDAVKALWLEEQRRAYERSRARLEARRPFEAAIRRSWWHTRPLDPAQLVNWVAYLDWSEAQGDSDDTAALYERCLVPCANYPEFWQRYVQWCESNRPDDAAGVLRRAVRVHCGRRPDLGVFAAGFYEARGQAEEARAQLSRLLDEACPGLIEVVVAAAHFERRAGDLQAATAVFERQIERQEQRLARKAGSGSRSSGGGGSGGSGSSNSSDAFTYLLYADFLRQACGDAERGREVLRRGLDAHPDARVLWEGAAFYEQQLPGPDRVQRVLALYDRALSCKRGAREAGPGQGGEGGGSGGTEPDAGAGAAGEAGEPAGEAPAPRPRLADEDAEELSRRCIDFADAHADVEVLRRVQRRHSELFMLPPHALAPPGRRAAGAANAAAAAAAANGPVARAACADSGQALPPPPGAAPDAAAGSFLPHGAPGAAAAYGYGHHQAQPPYGYPHHHHHHHHLQQHHPHQHGSYPPSAYYGGHHGGGYY